MQEAEALHRKEEDEAAARHALDYLQQEEQLKLQGAAEVCSIAIVWSNAAELLYYFNWTDKHNLYCLH